MIYVRAKNVLGTSPHVQITCNTPAPNGNDQYAAVSRIAHLGNIASGYTLQQFKDAKNPSDPNNPTIAPFPYLTWRDDNCSMPGWIKVSVQSIIGWGDEYIPRSWLGGPKIPLAPKAPLKEGCWRHDFAWRNLARMELQYRIDTWNQTNYNLSNDRLKADWIHICNITYTGGWSLIGVDCRNLSGTASIILNSQGPSVDEYLKEYESKAEDVGYAQD